MICQINIITPSFKALVFIVYPIQVYFGGCSLTVYQKCNVAFRADGQA